MAVSVDGGSSNNLIAIDLSSSDITHSASLIRQACWDSGFFYVINHGIRKELFEELFDQSRNFFQLPLEEKMKVLKNENVRGYTPFMDEILDPSKQTKGDTKEGYYIGVEVAKDDPRAAKSFFGPNVWPSADVLPGWKETMEKYHQETLSVGRRVARLIALALNLEADFFDKPEILEEPIAILRLLHYSDEISKPELGIYGTGAHSDFGLLTLLVTDEVSGLQICKNKDAEPQIWEDVHPLRGAFIVNIGQRSCRCIVLPLLLLSALALLSVHFGFPSAFPDQKKKTHDGISDSNDAIYDHVVDVAALTRSEKLEIGEEGLLSDSAEFRFNSSSYLAAECEGRRVYMHELPPEFNSGILSQCDAYEAYWLNFCDFAKNWGFGLKTHRRSKSWYRTEAYMVEIIFHERMKRYPCLAASASEAEAFYIPYYSGLDSLRFLFGNDVNRSHEHGVQLVEWLQANAGELWARNGGADHFVVMGRTAWDFSRALHRREGWGTSLLELPGLLNVTSLVLESRSFPWQEQAIPYPTSFHPAGGVNLHMWMSRVRRSRRTFLFSFAGGGGTGNSPNIRHSIRMECSDNPSPSSNPGCAFIDCEGNKCDHDPGYLMRRMMKADFCLQPPGDTPTRQSTFDGIVAGCIPVFFEKQGAYTQYTWHLPADPGDYSVLIPKDDVVFGDLKIGQILGNFSRQEIFRMRENVISLIPNVIYRNPEAAAADEFRDAFDIAIDGVLQRVKNKNKSNPQTHSQL